MEFAKMSSKSTVIVRDSLQSNITVCDDDTAQFWSLWIISDYENMKKNIAKNKYIESTKVISVIDEIARFRLRLYPNGSAESCGTKTSVFITSISSGNEKVWIQFRCQLLVDEKYETKYISVTNGVYSIGQNEQGFPDFFPVDLPTNGSNGCLQIICEGTVWSNEPPVKDRKNYQLRKGSNARSTPELFYTDTRRPCDAKVTVANGTVDVPVHKAFLCTKSVVFQQKFQSVRDNNINIPNVTSEVFREVLYFLCTNTLTVNVETLLPEVLKFADEYELAYLKEICLIKMLKKISVENAVDYYRVGSEVKAVELKYKSMRFITSNGAAICRQESFRKFKSEHREMGELLENLMISTQTVVTM